MKNMHEIKLSKQIASLFNWQATNVKPIESDEIADIITTAIKQIPGAVSSSFKLEAGDCLYRYFIEDNTGKRHVKFSTSISDIIEDSIKIRKITSAYNFGGIPVFKI